MTDRLHDETPDVAQSGGSAADAADTEAAAAVGESRAEIRRTSVSELGAVLRDRGDNIHTYNPNLSVSTAALLSLSPQPVCACVCVCVYVAYTRPSVAVGVCFVSG